MTTGERIKAKRTELGMTQAELAEKLYVSRSTVSNWEIDRNYPDIQSILQISQVLDISLDSLLKEGDGAEIIEADKKIRRKQKRKIRLLLLLVILLIGVTATLQIGQASEVRYPGQISSVEVKKTVLKSGRTYLFTAVSEGIIWMKITMMRKWWIYLYSAI